VSAVADKELSAKLTFEATDLLGKRRPREVQPLCSATEVQLLGNCDEVGQLPEFHPVNGRADLG
jgi:hypothetical protein